MPALTRRRYRDAREECWHIHFGDVHAGTIGLRTGVPHDAGSLGLVLWVLSAHPGECTTGAAATFDDARAGFEAAWRVFLARRTEADFQAWRDAGADRPGNGSDAASVRPV